MSASQETRQIALSHPHSIFVNGEWVSPSSEGLIEIVSPVSEEVIYTVAEAREADIDRAVAAARAAFDEGPWPRLSHAERAGYLLRFADALERRNAELGHAWTAQIGALYARAQNVGLSGVATFKRYAEMASTFPFSEPHTPSDGHGRALIVREPVGVVAAIVPWNAPLPLSTNKTAPALLAGCTMVLKASPETPLEAYIMAEIAEEIGLPPGVFNVVCAHRSASEHLVRNPGVDKVSFTGSSATGRHIASILVERMARYTMELGGKSAAIVLDDMETDRAVGRLASGICANSGQICAALSRVIVPRKRYDDFVDGFATAMRALTPGDPYDPSSALGPLAMQRQLERVASYVEKGKAEGAKLVVGGKRPPGLNRGYYFEPTLFADVDNRMTIAQEEIFGPVLCLIPADDDDDAVRIANASPYGLNGAIFTHDNRRAYELACKVRSGNVSQNRFRVDFGVGFGGVKQSGVGREGGKEGLHGFLEPKTMLLD